MTITIQVPDVLLEDLATTPQELSREIRLAAAIHLFSRGLVSQGKGAEIAALNRWEFIQALGLAGVPACQVTANALTEEVECAFETHRQYIAADPSDQNQAN